MNWYRLLGAWRVHGVYVACTWRVHGMCTALRLDDVSLDINSAI